MYKGAHRLHNCDCFPLKKFLGEGVGSGSTDLSSAFTALANIGKIFIQLNRNTIDPFICEIKQLCLWNWVNWVSKPDLLLHKHEVKCCFILLSFQVIDICLKARRTPVHFYGCQCL